jgi:RimJ/RimL family protein N-acetyltransferase
VHTPAELSENERAHVCSIVRQYGRVETEGLPERIEHAWRIAIASDGGRVYALAAIKRPDRSYLERVSAASEHALDPAWAELGWFVTLPGYRGRGACTRLVRALLAEYTGTLWVTARDDDTATSRVLASIGMAPVGSGWNSVLDGRVLHLWLKQTPGRRSGGRLSQSTNERTFTNE